MSALAEKNEAWPLSPELERLDALVSDDGGLIDHVRQISEPGDPFFIYVATLGSLEHLHVHLRPSKGISPGLELAGSGGSTNPRLARAIAIVEAVERYSSCVPPENLLVSSWSDLGQDSLKNR